MKPLLYNFAQTLISFTSTRQYCTQFGFNLFCTVIYTTLKIKLMTYAKITERTSVKLKEVYLGRD